MRRDPTALETWGVATHSPSDPDSHQGNPEKLLVLHHSLVIWNGEEGKLPDEEREREKSSGFLMWGKKTSATSQCVTSSAFHDCIMGSISQSPVQRSSPPCPHPRSRYCACMLWKVAQPFQVTGWPLWAAHHPYEREEPCPHSAGNNFSLHASASKWLQLIFCLFLSLR